ncbi:MAG: prepilin-type N-terminal cleavage/methylation domain-containing protein [Sulfuricaulis sp.]|nr:prepilin-type N-terminal cleavage/methylation domain-containing protein [Sulfuricaulis sp.]
MRLLLSDSGSNAGCLCRSRGVSLIELVVVITISGIIATVLGAIIVHPIQGYEAQVRRAQLVDAAEMAVRRLGRDIRQALPNSVRVRDALGNTNSVSCSTAGAACTIEMLNTLDGARYRDGPGNIGHDHGPTQYRLRFNGTDTDGFNIAGFFQNITVPFTSTTQRLSVYNQGATGADAYADANSDLTAPRVITNPTYTTFSINNDNYLPTPDEHPRVPLTGSFRVRYASPNQRVFVVDTPVSYVCSAGANGNITRYWSYPITAAQQSTPAGATTALLSTPVTACNISYSPGTNQRAGLVTLDITVRDNDSGEQVRLLYQVHVDNSP